MSMKLTPLRFLEKVKKIITENLIGGTNITLTTDTDNKVTINADAIGLNDLSDVAYSGGTITITDGLRIVGLKKRVIDVNAALNLADTAAALEYAGATFSVAAGQYAITLPTATSTAEAAQLVGWHISLIITTASARTLTIVRGDTSNDSISGIVVAGDAAASGITISSNVITFVAGTAVVGDRVDITCVGADASNTIYTAQGFCAV
tara:strand:+ start:191 stop:811 length:621 start_codon:yes stop_codon:yes gene_type:complete